jgi:CAAX family protease
MTTKTKILTTLSALLAFFSAQFVLMSINTFGQYAYSMLNFWIASALTLICTAYSYITISKHDAKHPRKHEYKYRYTLLAIGIYYLFLVVLTVILTKLGIAPQKQDNQSSIDSLLKTSAIVLIVYVTIIAPIIEELLFRYILPKAFNFNKIAEIIAYAVGFILFVTLHMPNGITGLLTYGGMGVLFTFMRIYYDNINASILTHITWNVIVVAIMLL